MVLNLSFIYMQLIRNIAMLMMMGHLRRAFHSQQDMDMDHLSNEEDTLKPDMTASLDDEGNGPVIEG
jgi:hypothetical protein